MKVSELSGFALDWAVAKCEYQPVCDGFDDNCPEYSSNWAEGGPIIEREKTAIRENGYGHWFAKVGAGKWMHGPTPLIAAMRCYVASKLGKEITVPEAYLETSN